MTIPINDAAEVFYGNIQADEIYLGDLKVWPPAPSYPPPINLTGTSDWHNDTLIWEWAGEGNPNQWECRRSIDPLVIDDPTAGTIVATWSGENRTGAVARTTDETFYYVLCAIDQSNTHSAYANVAVTPSGDIPAYPPPSNLTGTLNGSNVVLNWVWPEGEPNPSQFEAKRSIDPNVLNDPSLGQTMGRWVGTNRTGTVGWDFGGDPNYFIVAGMTSSNAYGAWAGCSVFQQQQRTMTAIDIHPESVKVGGTVTLTATVTIDTPTATAAADAGEVQFMKGGVPLGSPVPVDASGVAIITDVPQEEGALVYSASYLGTEWFIPSESPVTMGAAGAEVPTTVTLSADPQPVAVGGTLTLKARVVAEAGDVQFRKDGAALGAPVPVDAAGVAIITDVPQAEGTLTYTVDYLGTTDNPPGTSPPVEVEVTAAGPYEIVLISASGSTAVYEVRGETGLPEPGWEMSLQRVNALTGKLYFDEFVGTSGPDGQITVYADVGAASHRVYSGSTNGPWCGLPTSGANAMDPLLGEGVLTEAKIDATNNDIDVLTDLGGMTGQLLNTNIDANNMFMNFIKTMPTIPPIAPSEIPGSGVWTGGTPAMFFSNIQPPRTIYIHRWNPIPTGPTSSTNSSSVGSFSSTYTLTNLAPGIFIKHNSSTADIIIGPSSPQTCDIKFGYTNVTWAEE